MAVIRISSSSSATLSCQKREISLCFSLLLAGEEFEHNHALPRC